MKKSKDFHSAINWRFRLPFLICSVAVILLTFVFAVGDFARLFDRSVLGFSHEQTRKRSSQSPFLLGVSSEPFSGDPYRTFPLKGRIFDDNSNFPRKRVKSNFESKCLQWGVVTTINAPTESVNNVAQVPGWCLVVVGDEKTPEPYELPLMSGSYYLGKNDQEEFCRNVHDFCQGIPWNHFGRKNIGYLYAIAHGATQIWDFDDDNMLLAAAPPQISDDIVMKEVHGEKDCHIFNPYPVMGGPTGKEYPSWPRGLPLDVISIPCDVTVEEVHNPLHVNVGVVQSLANNEPDVDAIYRLTRGTPFDFDVKHEWFVLGENLLTPYNAQATMIFGSALWSLLLPMTVHSRVSDIWRSYVAQRLMKDIGVRVVFSPPHVRQDRNSHNLLGDLKAEDALYHQATSLCRFLNSWSGATGSLPGRFEELMVALYERGFLEIDDVYMAQKWISALFLAGYKFPALIENVTEMALMPGQEQGPSSEKCIENKRVLVTGVNGMIGSHLARELVQRSCYTLFGLVRPRSNLDSLVGVLDRITLVIGDITDGPRMESIVRQTRPDFVYHMAAQAINGISYDLAQLTMDANVRGTLNILEACRQLGRNPVILLAGSSTEYGETADKWDKPLSEDAPLVPVSPYGVSKVATENLGRQFFLSYGMNVITARFFIQIGIGGTDSLAIHQFCKQIAMAEAGFAEPILYHGNLMSKRDMTDARDSVPAVIKLAEYGKAGEAYNVGTGKSHSMKDLLDTAKRLSKIPIETKIDPVRYRVYDERELVADVSKMKGVTGWSPERGLDDSVETILEYWREKVNYLHKGHTNNTHLSTEKVGAEKRKGDR